MEHDSDTTAINSRSMRVRPESTRLDSGSRCYVSGTHPETMMLTEITLAGYGPIKEEITLRPTPLHALIGPNDSGKTSILEGINDAFKALREGKLQNAVRLRRLPNQSLDFRLRLSSELYFVEFNPDSDGRPRIGFSHPNMAERAVSSENVFGEFGRAEVFRPLINSLKKPSQLLPEDRHDSFLKSGGEGLPGLFDFIRDLNDDSMKIISNEISSVFPNIARIGLNPVSNTEKEIVAYLQDGSRVPASLLSDGVVLFMGFAVIKHLSNIKTILLEEPENGLHPARIRDVMKVLRATSEAGIQIILTTHSPLVLNEMKPEEVTVVTRDREKGTQVWPLAETPFFKARAEDMTLGEIWLGYCDGDQETDLVRGVEP